MRAWDACVAKYSQPYVTVGFGISLTKYGVYIKYLVTLTGMVTFCTANVLELTCQLRDEWSHDYFD